MMKKKRKKEPTRSEVLRKKSATEGLVSAAAFVVDHLSELDAFCRYDCNGLSVRFDCGRGDRLSSPVKQYMQNLLKENEKSKGNYDGKFFGIMWEGFQQLYRGIIGGESSEQTRVNMEGPFGAEWPTEEKAKRQEMVAPEARYSFVWDDSGESMNKKLTDVGRCCCCEEDSLNLVGFVHFRFIVAEELPILYVYELQLESRIQGKGLGNFLMELVEVIAKKEKPGKFDSVESLDGRSSFGEIISWFILLLKKS